jgi:copper(I)-binding protein
MGTFRTGPILALALFTVLALASTPASSRECLPRVRDGWVRLGPAGMPMMAGFAGIENACPAPVTITAASSPAFDSVELHETRIVDGVNRMRHLPELQIAANGVAVLMPGGMHLMLMRPHAPLEVGGKVAVSFELSDGRRVPGEFEVRKPDALR